MAKKKTRLEELKEYAKSVGLHVATWSPGDGTTRYRFFTRAGNTYFGPDSGIYTALGIKDAWDYLYGYAARGAAHATVRAEAAAPFSLRRVKLNRGGYDEDGRYWGQGEPLWTYDNRDTWGHLRASTREAAKRALRAKYSGASFLRG